MVKGRWSGLVLSATRSGPRGERRTVFEGRAAIGYDHGYDAQKFYLGLALDPKHIEGVIEGCLERIGKTSQKMKPFSGIFGRIRANGRQSSKSSLAVLKA